MAICSGVVLYVVLTNLSAIFDRINNFLILLSPLILGIVIAYVLNPLVNLFENRVFRKLQKKGDLHAPSVVISLLIVIAFMYLILHSLIPQLIDSILTLAGNINEYTKHVKTFLEELKTKRGLKIDVDKITGNFNQVMNNIFDNIPSYASTAASMTATIGGKLLNWVLGFILAIYFQFAKKGILQTCKKFFRLLLGEVKYKHFSGFLDRCNDIMVRYITCEILEGILIGTINAIFMAICKMPYIALISVVVGVTNMIPSFGPIIGGIIGGFILLLVQPKAALAFIIFTFILQFFDGYILKPKMYGNTLGVPSALILTFIIIGGKFFGITGIILSIPAAAIVCILYAELVIPNLAIWRMERDGKMCKTDEVYFEEIETESDEGDTDEGESDEE